MNYNITKVLYYKSELSSKKCLNINISHRIYIHLGAHDDLKRVTKMAYAQVRSYGMGSERVGLMSYPDGDSRDSGKRPYSQGLQQIIDQVRN